MSASVPFEVIESPAVPAYASFSARVRALLVDVVVIFAAALGIVLFIALTEALPYTGQVGIVALFGFLALYEPVMVATSGATVGHRRANLRVVSLATGDRPSFPQALARFVIKGALGILSFVTMALTRRHQAVHDRITGTTVQIRDLDAARPSDVRWERTEPEPAGLPSRRRRAAVIIGYAFLSFIVLSIVFAVVLSDACALAQQCTPGENLFSTGLGLLWIGAIAWIIVAGWRGRLWGGRRQAEPASVDHSA